MSKLDELKVKMTEAVKVFTATGDMSQIQAVNAELNKAKAEIAKAESAKLLAEAEKLAGVREALSTKIHQAVRALGLDKSITDVKGWGFTYKVDNAVPGAEDVRYKSVALSIQTVKARKAGAGGGAGKSKDEYGMSLADIVDKFATAEEQAGIANADSNSKSWQLKTAVKKRAIAEGKLAPVK